MYLARAEKSHQVYQAMNRYPCSHAEALENVFNLLVHHLLLGPWKHSRKATCQGFLCTCAMPPLSWLKRWVMVEVTAIISTKSESYSICRMAWRKSTFSQIKLRSSPIFSFCNTHLTFFTKASGFERTVCKGPELKFEGCQSLCKCSAVLTKVAPRLLLYYVVEHHKHYQNFVQR